jgi:hypothetical protein
MANLRSTRYFFLLAFQFLVLLQTNVLCYQYKVGDLDAWGIPTSANPQVYTKWSKYHTIKIGDSLCKFPIIIIIFLCFRMQLWLLISGFVFFFLFLFFFFFFSIYFSVFIPTKPRFTDTSHGRILQQLQP